MLRVDNHDLPMLEQMRQAMQKHRIQMNNRASAVERGVSTLNPETALYFQEKFQGLEDELAGLISRAVKDHEMWDWLDRVKGIGPGLAGSLLATIDIERAQTVSALWRYAGQGVVDGESERRQKGKKLGYNAGLKKTCYLIGSSFLKANSLYRREYDEAKTYYQTNRPDWTPKHVDMAARRKMVKLFLCFSPDTELWTIDGPRNVAKIDNEDLLATMNPVTGCLEYHRPLDLHHYDYKGDLIHFQSESFDFMVTPNHRMWTKHRSDLGWGFVEAGRFLSGISQQQEEADRIVSRSGAYPSIRSAAIALSVSEATLRRWISGRRPVGLFAESMQFDTQVEWHGEDVDEIDGIPTDDWLTFLGWFLSDGHSYKHVTNPGGYIVGITQKDTSVLEDLAQLVQRMGYSPFIKTNCTTPQIRVYNKELYERMKIFGKAADKFIPPQIKNLPPHRLRILLAALAAGDGTKDESGDCYRYSTISIQLAWDVAEIAWKCGYGFKLRSVDRDYGQKLYIVNLRTNRNKPRIVQPILAEPYSGPVHCVTVSNHLVFAGRNGKFAWTGNSHLWTEWRTRRGLPVRDPYAMQVLNHDGHKPAENYLESIHEAKPKTRGRPALLDHPLADPSAEARSSRSRRAVAEAV